MLRHRRLGVAAAWTVGFAVSIAAQPAPLAQRVLILVNDQMPAEAGTNGTGAGLFVGQYYAKKRGIPANHIVHLKTSTDEWISWSDYQSQIETPVRQLLDANGGALRQSILYIVPVYGMPLKIGAPGQILAVDSVLAALYAPGTAFQVANPYYAAPGTRPPHFDAWADRRQANGGWKMFLVSRLDGPTAAIAQGLVDKAAAAEPSLTGAGGTGYFDYQGTRTPADGVYYTADQDMQSAASFSKAKGFPTVLNTQANAVCRLMIHPASAYYYDPGGRNLYVASYGTRTSNTRAFSPMQEGDVVLGIHGNVNNTGNFAYVTLGTSDPNSYIRLTYPLAPFTNYNGSDQILLEKVVAGAGIKATAAVDTSMQAALDGVNEFRIHVENGLVSVLRNGASLISLTDAAASPLQLSSLSIGSLCWDYILTGIRVSDKGGQVLFSDDFSANSAGNYQWNLAPLQGQNALWAWGWYGTAYDSYRFVPGAIGAQLTSYTATTIRKPLNPDPAVYSVADRRWGPNWVPRMLEEGVTGTWGAVDEPYAQFYASGADFFDHFWNGYNFGESFYLAENVLRWTMVAVGDPLYAPAVFQPAGGTVIKRVVNAASYQDGPVAPGELVAIMGEGLGGEQGVTAQTAGGSLPRQVGSTQVWFDNVAAPLLFVGAEQVNAIVPYAVAGAATTQLQVEANGVLSAAVTLPVAPSAPGLLSADSSGTGQGAVLNQDYSSNSPSNPAPKGSMVMLFGTGDGVTTPLAVEGTVLAATSQIAATVSVSIGGIEGPAQFAGEVAGQLAGVFQINARIPDNTPSGPAVPVVVRIGGNASQEGITVAVQ